MLICFGMWASIAISNYKVCNAAHTKGKRTMGKKTGWVELDGVGRIQFEDADSPMTIEIQECDVRSAVCRDPQKCVLAVAFRRAFGPLFDYVIVGKTVIHVVMNGKSKRFWLGSALQGAIDMFDRTRGHGMNGQGIWRLPPGKYTLETVPSYVNERPNRHHLYGGKGGKKQGIKGSTILEPKDRKTTLAPTRFISRKGA